MSKKKTILFIGSFLSNSKGTKGIAEKIRPFLGGEYNLLYASSYVNKFFRMLDVLKRAVFSRYDVVHCDVFSGQAFWVSEIVRRITQLRGKKIVMNLQGGRFIECLNESPARLNVFRKWVSLNITIISPSHFLSEGLKEKYKADIPVVPNFIDLNRFPYNPLPGNGFRLLWVRAFNAAYQPEIAVEALKWVRKRYPNASLTMVGPDKGTLEQTIELIKKYGLSDFVELTGPISNTELFNFFHSHDVYLNTTAYESFGLAVCEAAACGIPIVSTKVGELPYIWEHGKNIIFSTEQTGEAFAEAIELLFDDRNLKRAIVKSAKEKVNEYQWECVKERWEKLWEKR